MSVVRINGNIFPVGTPTLRSYDATRFGAGARVFDHVKVVLWHVVGRVDLHTPDSRSKLVT